MKEKYDTILKYEERIASDLTQKVFKPKELEFGIKVLIPILLFIDYAMIKMDMKRTQVNLLFTKKLALDTARNIKAGGKRCEEREKIISKTNELLEKDKKGVYSKEVRDAQLKEIDLLIDHNLKLFDAEGKEYKDLVKHAYGTKDEYISFLNKLSNAEEKVNQAAIKTLKVESKKELRKWFSKLEMATKKIRTEVVEKIFQVG